jgi:hypothetical protein
MKRYKVEGLIYYSKVTLDMDHIVTSSTKEIQEKLDEYARAGWRLVSTNASNFGFAMYIYLYFESDGAQE